MFCPKMIMTTCNIVFSSYHCFSLNCRNTGVKLASWFWNGILRVKFYFVLRICKGQFTHKNIEKKKHCCELVLILKQNNYLVGMFCPKRWWHAILCSVLTCISVSLCFSLFCKYNVSVNTGVKLATWFWDIKTSVQTASCEWNFILYYAFVHANLHTKKIRQKNRAMAI